MLVSRLLCASMLMLASLVTFSQEQLINSAALIRQGVELHDAGKYGEAIAIYDRITSSDSNYVLALYEKALSAEADSLFPLAIKYCEQAFKIKSQREREPQLYSLYGSVIDKMGNPERANRVYDSAIAKYPAYSALYVNKAITFLNNNQAEKADEIIRKGLLIDPFSPSLHYYYGKVSLSKGKVVPSMLAFCTYLTLLPNGQQKNMVINLLSAIANNEDGVVKLVNERKEETPANYQEIEQIIASKIALEKNYQKITSLDDPICRQLQVTLEKLSFDESEPDFAMQFYAPMYRQIFENKLFEPFICYIFSSTNLKEIDRYNKNNKKEIQKFAVVVNDYMSVIRATRELSSAKRAGVTNRYYFDEGKLVARGVFTSIKTGKWNYYYAAGNPKATGDFDANDKKDGEWKYYYFNGQLESVEQVKGGILEGASDHFYENGRPSMQSTYKNGELHGTSTAYYKTGGIKSKLVYNAGALLSKEEYFESGVLKTTQLFKNNELDGAFTVYHSNGNKQKVGTALKDKLHGSYQYYNENGVLAIEGNYQDGVQTGTWKFYHENGKLKAQTQYVNDLPEGEYVEYHVNGQLSTKYINKNGKTTGKVPYYDENGRLYCLMTFKEDVVTSCKYLDKSGNPTKVFESNRKGIDMTYHNPFGAKVSQVFMNDKGEMSGVRTYYNPSGTVTQTETYVNGELDGKVASYFANSNKKLDLSYVRGEKDGYYTSYFQNGTRQEEGWYVAGSLQGTWKEYYKNGKVSSTTEYLDGDREGVKTDYWPDGRKDVEHYYEGDVLASIVQYDTLGNTINTVNFKDGNGKFTLLSVNGKKRLEGAYTANGPSGEWTEYFPDGSIESVKSYKNGLVEGVFREYFVGGKLFREGKFVKNQKSGEWKTYYQSGVIDKVENFINGELTGKVSDYYENGKVNVESEYEAGELHGIHRHYAENGELMIQVQYQRDAILNYTYNGKDNKLVAPIDVNNQTGKIVAYYANGKKSVEFELIDGLFNNDYKTYSSEGVLQSESKHQFGAAHGDSKWFYPDGKARILTSYLDNQEEGLYRAYHANGKLRREGLSTLDMSHGVTKLYDEKGNQTETRIFYFDQLIEIRK